MFDEIEKRVFPSASYSADFNPWMVSRGSGLWGRLINNENKETIKGCVAIDSQGMSLYSDVVLCEDRLIFVPGMQAEVPILCIYDLKQKEEQKIVLEKRYIREGVANYNMFFRGIAVGNYVFMLGSAYPAIVRVDVISGEVSYVDKWYYEVQTRVGIEKAGSFFYNYSTVVEGNKLYVASSCFPGVLKIDVDTLEEKLLVTNAKAKGFNNILSVAENEFLLTSYLDDDYNSVWIIDKQNGSVVDQIVMDKGMPGWILQDECGLIYIFPSYYPESAEMDIYCFDKNNRKLEKLEVFSKLDRISRTVPLYGEKVVYASWKDKNTFTFVTGKDLIWHDYSLISRECRDYEKVIEDDIPSEILTHYYREKANKRIPLREKNVSLSSFMLI